jgi:hypothetical protein
MMLLVSSCNSPSLDWLSSVCQSVGYCIHTQDVWPSTATHPDYVWPSIATHLVYPSCVQYLFASSCPHIMLAASLMSTFPIRTASGYQWQHTPTKSSFVHMASQQHQLIQSSQRSVHIQDSFPCHHQFSNKFCCRRAFTRSLCTRMQRELEVTDLPSKSQCSQSGCICPPAPDHVNPHN